MPTHTNFRDVSHVSDPLLSDQLESNWALFIQWALLGVGGFQNVEKSQSGCYGADLSRLRPVTDPYLGSGLVWEGFRKDWVWETGVEYPLQPIRVSGVYVNESFLPLASGVVVDYPNGRVTLPSAVAVTSTVKAAHSYRLFQVSTADAPFWNQVQTRSLRPDDPQFLQNGSGAWDPHPGMRTQLPAVVVEAGGYGSRRGKELMKDIQVV
jgi:hypothetical protein